MRGLVVRDHSPSSKCSWTPGSWGLPEAQGCASAVDVGAFSIRACCADLRALTHHTCLHLENLATISCCDQPFRSSAFHDVLSAVASGIWLARLAGAWLLAADERAVAVSANFSPWTARRCLIGGANRPLVTTVLLGSHVRSTMWCSDGWADTLPPLESFVAPEALEWCIGT